MKQKLLLITLLCCGFMYNSVKANETEPNDTKAQANTLSLNGSNSGTIGTATDVDWFKVTTNGDGKLNLTLAVSNGLNCYYALYDNDGTTLLHQEYTAGTSSYSVDGLATGTYYIKIYPYFSGQMPAYTISNTLTKPAQANDTEPDSTRAQALTLTLNGSTTGHIDYYYKNHRDSVDWYKVTTNADGRLRLTMTSANGQNVWAYLYDNDGTTQLGGAYTSGSAVVVNRDGLAAGTYYIRVNTYYTTEFAPYTLSDSLFTPSISNDTEPDSTRAQALTLPLNGSKQGHVNYYYNNHKDSVDWYKVTTNGDGRLRITMTSGNGQNVWAYLFDNDAKTPIASGYTSGSAVVVNQDGLAAGTYYIRVNTYYTSEFAPYTLADSLFKPTEANDAEPDSSKATALTLPLNGSVTGHVDYYYNNHRDSVDEYKLVTNADGNINLSLSIPNGTNVWFNLYDNDGTTLLHQAYTPGDFNYNVDGLSKGTYYVKVFCYYNGQFAPYTLKNKLTGYNANDHEPNKYAKQASTLLARLSNGGHIDFYYDNKRDTVDWTKINYTGANNGSMTITFKLLPHISDGGINPTWIQVYRDTASSPLFSQYYSSSSANTITLNSLSQGYYYVKVYEYYNGQFEAYSINPSFYQQKIAKIVTSSYTKAAGCADTNHISYTISNTNPNSPSTVQLYRFGIAYGKPIVVAKGKAALFDTLPTGVYYATAFADGATGNAYGTSDTVTLEAVPTGLTTTGITKAKATLNWAAEDCAKYFVINYRKQGTSTWTSKKTKGNVDSLLLTSLKANTTYTWKVATADSANGQIVQSAFSDTANFTTAASLFAGANSDEENSSANGITNHGTVMISPNPATSFFVIHYNDNTPSKVNASVYDANGKAIWSSGLISANALNGKQVNVSQFAKGVFYLKIINENGELVGNAKIVVAK